MIEATYNGTAGQAFTNAPADFSGTLADIMKLDYDNIRTRNMNSVDAAENVEKSGFYRF